MSSEEHPKVQKDQAWLAVNDSPLDPEHSKVGPQTPELGSQRNITQSCKPLVIHYTPTDDLASGMTFALVGLL